MSGKPLTTLVTGASRGLGLEFARQYAADGWKVYAACRAPADAGELARLAADSRDSIEVLPIDVADPASVRAAAARLAGVAIDLLLNNAGVGSPKGQKLGSLDYGAWARVLDVNTLGPMRVTEAFLPNLERGAGKKVVTITSKMGSIDDNGSGGSYAYRTSKAAVNMAVKSLSIDLAPRGITCIVVHPGWVRTDMGGPGGLISPEQSITGIRRIIAALSPADAGKFFNYDGTPIPW
jgi:NAD(P)-dependent dehydrogenase (short-subunit alcohol dehydrogenase family)